jgi:N-acyl-D-amino-acid deacylase
MKNLLLANGTLIDGTGSPRREADVLIRNGKIQDTGSIPSLPDCETVDCTGLTIVPGFVDVHSHSDQEVLQHLPNKILQGVTTEIVGNCGFSLFPSCPNSQGERLTGELFDGEPPEGMANTQSYFDKFEQNGSLVNVAALTGHAAVRLFVLKMRRHVQNEEEMRAMEGLLEECLTTGSIGFSTGLNCPPSSFGGFEELVGFCRIVKKHDAFYTTHLRDYKFKVTEAVDEAIALGRTAQVPVQFSHMQVVGRKNWHKLDRVLEQVESALNAGIDVGMDAYPYLAGSCSVTQFLPDWSQEGGVSALLGHLRSSAQYRRIAEETNANMSNAWDDIMVCDVRTADNRGCIGKSIQKIADERKSAAVDTALDLLLEEEGFVYIISFNQNMENLRKVLTHPLTSIITDGMVMEGKSHPRTYGTYPKFLGEFIREKQWMSLEEAVVKTSALAARRFRLAGRGTIEPGNWADITIFDAAKIGTEADYEKPALDPQGIHHVLVNGQFAVQDSKLTGRHCGMALRHKSRN